ncbi:MAG: dihydrofolate reductase family protein, partial [Rhizobium sp.]|nr:dihydrofolate reductase family protein [Rhizobium sp.]
SATGHRGALETRGVEILETTGLEHLLHALAGRGISSLMVEGGARVAADLLAQGLVDRIHLYTGTTVVGEGGIASPITRNYRPAGFALLEETSIGGDHRQILERLPVSAWL